MQDRDLNGWTIKETIGKGKINMGNGEVMCECRRIHSLGHPCECEREEHGKEE
jgi:hypothetical protein